MAMIATDYEILRGVKASCLNRIPLQRKPVRVATIIDEDKFLENCEMRHWHTVFLEDKSHDWDWRDGSFYYYTRVSERADVLVVYAFEEKYIPAMFDPMTGKPL